ncbi:MAG TPA: ABC transporter ATP-binding protein [Solirubrobacteraceae bacterium]|nr:ABC transporter ATP-binding protein [Solirubrobacteraceae bacterium]
MRPYFHVHEVEVSVAQVPPVSVAAETTPALQVRGLTRRFGERVAVRDASFELEAGERLAIIGPNGAGKTTLLSMLAGVLAPSSGEIGATAGRIGWVPQQPAVYSKLSVAENLRLFARLERLPDPETAVEQMLGQTGLHDRRADQVSRLSGGNQQRLNIAIGLLNRPAVLLLDEPSSALDPRQRERLWEFIVDLSRQGTSVIYSTHNVLEAERYGDRVLVLGDGEVLFLGRPGELAAAVAGQRDGDFENAFVGFLRSRGH